MSLIILGVLIFGGLLALAEVIRNTRTSTAPYAKRGGAAPIIYLPRDLEREKRKRNIL